MNHHGEALGEFAHCCDEQHIREEPSAHLSEPDGPATIGRFLLAPFFSGVAMKTT